MEADDNLKKIYQDHLETCWKEYIHIKETKDKIVFFIGTLFITVLFGTGFLIFKSTDVPEDTKGTFDKLYVLQYFLMHFFFLLLYLYYTYNNVQEKSFLIECQCCHYKLMTTFEEYKHTVPVPFSLIKRYYSDGLQMKTFVKSRNLKDAGNVIMFIIYFMFSTIPMWFDKGFVLFDGKQAKLELNFSWLVIGFVGILLLVIVIFAGRQLILGIKKKILEHWDIPLQNQFNI
jgi:Ca2+/Na+ antiporter